MLILQLILQTTENIMKKIAFLLLVLLRPIVVSADTVEIDGIYYNLINKGGSNGAEVTRNPSKYSGSVIIPETVTYDGIEYKVTSIERSAFYNCTDLSSVTIPSSVMSIEGYVFYGCSNLTTVKIPNSVTSIGEQAFYGCSSLTSITIPSSVKSIGFWAFKICRGLSAVYISDIAAWCNTSFGGSESNPLYYASHLYIGEAEIKNLVIPNGVTKIENYAFIYCKSLISVTIPNSVTGIGEYAFRGCSGLTSVQISNSVTSIGGHTFDGCSNLTFITIPNNVTSIGSFAFSGCSCLTSVTIGSGVKDIYSQAFATCKELTDVYCLAEEVPTMRDSNNRSGGIDAFQNSHIEYATLHVPTASIAAYKAMEPWNGFKEIVALRSEDTQEINKCATPTIAYIDGKLVFDSETEGASFVSEIKTADTRNYYNKEVSLTPPTTTITVYATKADFDNSDVATATIGWRNGTPILEGFSSIKLEGIETNGDVNGDGTVDVADIATIISIMAGKQ